MSNRLNPIYRSDILSFMPHPNLHQKCRYVSRSFNSTIVTGTEAGRLPRRMFRCIDIRVNQMNPERLQRREPRFDHDGYSHDLPSWPTAFIGRQSMWGWSDNDRAKRGSIIDKLGCCWWKKPLSKSLAGQLLFPAFLPDAEISINVMPCNPKTTKGVCLAFRNELTAKTAFSLIHLLHHLKGSATLGANITFDVEGVDEGSSLNQAFILILRQQGMKFHAVDGRTGCGQLNEAEMRVLSEMAQIGAFHARAWADELFGSEEWGGWAEKESGERSQRQRGDAFFDFILSAGDYCRTLKLELQHCFIPLRWAQLEAGGDFFDAMIEVGRGLLQEGAPAPWHAFATVFLQKFESGIEQIGCHAISKLIFTHGLLSLTSLKEGEEAWPKRCPPKAASRVLEYVVNEEQDSDESEVWEEDDQRMELDGLSGGSSSDETSDEARDEEMDAILEMYSGSSSSGGHSTGSQADAGDRYRFGDEEIDEEDEPGESYRLYEFAFENFHSREPFRVVLKTVPGKENAIDTVEFILH